MFNRNHTFGLHHGLIWEQLCQKTARNCTRDCICWKTKKLLEELGGPGSKHGGKQIDDILVQDPSVGYGVVLVMSLVLGSIHPGTSVELQK